MRPVVQYLLSAWREEEQEREERKVQEEAMYRTRTLPGEEEESEQERKDYAMLFPSFSELFADLVQEEQFEGKNEEKEQEMSKDSAPIHDACSLLQRLLQHAAPSEQQCREVQEEREQQFLASYRLASSLLASKPGMSSPALDSSLLLPSICYIFLMRRQNLQEPPAQYDFYRHPNPAEAVAMVPLLTAVSARVIVLMDQLPENPLLEQVLKVKELPCPSSSPA